MKTLQSITTSKFNNNIFVNISPLIALGTLAECHKLLVNSNTLKNLLSRAEGRKDETVKVHTNSLIILAHVNL